MTQPLEIFQTIKSDFCNLLDYKIRGNTLEVITGIPTLSRAYVSVFISYQDGKFAASDGGWIDQNVYGNSAVDDVDILDRITSQFIDRFNIKMTKNTEKTTYYYKTCERVELVSAIVSDIGHFVAAIINARNLIYNEPAEDESQRRQFHNNLNRYIRKTYGEKFVDTKPVLKLNSDKSIQLNASVRVRSNQGILTYYLMYVTGSRSDLYIKDATKAIVNFKIIGDYAVPGSFYQRLAIVDKNVGGYNHDKTEVYLEQLTGVSDAPIISITDDKSVNLITQKMPLLELRDN